VTDVLFAMEDDIQGDKSHTRARAGPDKTLLKGLTARDRPSPDSSNSS